MTHTPGPWAVDDDRDRIYIRPDGTGWLLAVVPRDLFMAQQKQEWSIEANARLIAAAPDLLTACKVALNDRMFKDWPTIAPILIAAIAKAEGTER